METPLPLLIPSRLPRPDLTSCHRGSLLLTNSHYYTTKGPNLILTPPRQPHQLPMPRLTSTRELWRGSPMKPLPCLSQAIHARGQHQGRTQSRLLPTKLRLPRLPQSLRCKRSCPHQAGQKLAGRSPSLVTIPSCRRFPLKQARDTCPLVP
jgi:hypothetical protein